MAPAPHSPRSGPAAADPAVELHPERAAATLVDREVPLADAVVPGLPWAAYSGPVPLHAAIGRAPAQHGPFTRFAHSPTRHRAPPARARPADLRRHVADVAIGPTVSRNIAPAAVHEARRARDGG